MIRRASGVSTFNIDKFSEVFGLRSMQKVLSKRGDFCSGCTFSISYQSHLMRYPSFFSLLPPNPSVKILYPLHL